MTGEPPNDPIELLREQIRVATAAAERLLRETRAGTGSPRVAGADPAADPPPPPPPPPPAGAGSVPPSGWAAPESAGEATSELQALAQLFAAVRNTLPEEIVHQIVDLIRQLLLVLRAVIDWAVARMERGPRGSDVQVEDIPIS
jgi:hypothetical protein